MKNQYVGSSLHGGNFWDIIGNALYQILALR